MDEENSKNMSRYLNFIAEKNQVKYLIITIAFIIFSWILIIFFKSDTTFVTLDITLILEEKRR